MDGNQNVTAMGRVSGEADGAQATAAATAKETETGQNQTFTQSDVDKRVQEAL